MYLSTIHKYININTVQITTTPLDCKDKLSIQILTLVYISKKYFKY